LIKCPLPGAIGADGNAQLDASSNGNGSSSSNGGSNGSSNGGSSSSLAVLPPDAYVWVNPPRSRSSSSR
jgi:hypothetical protein